MKAGLHQKAQWWIVCSSHKRIQSLSERIFGAMYMGYPAIRFSNKVGGKMMDLRWNGGNGQVATRG
jgi:hypothetical protein